MRLFNKKNDDKKVKVAIKEGEKIYREVIDEETGDVTYEEIKIPGDKKEKTEDEKSEKKSVFSKISTPVKVVGAIGIAAVAGAVVGAKAAASKDNKSESVPTENQGFEDNAE